MTNAVNGAYTRYNYANNHYYVQSYTTINDLNPANEFYTITLFDGADRVRAVVRDHPSSAGGYSSGYNVYDTMGRLVQQSNPTEINSWWAPSGDDAAGYVWSQQAYAWQGRPTIFTNQDGTTRSIGCGGCGCAGGTVVTFTDEVGRKQKSFYDVLGRVWKTQSFNWDGVTVYSTTITSYNARDQVTEVKTYQGTETSDCPDGGCQKTILEYDGHGRLWRRWLPIYQASSLDPNFVPSATPYDQYEYSADDQMLRVTDPRGASQSFSYNARHLMSAISYSSPDPNQIPLLGNVTFSYDEAGNRTSMTDGLGSVSYAYNTLDQMTSKTRTFTGVGSFTLNYTYHLGGQLSSLTDPFNARIDYTYDRAGRLQRVAGTGFLGTQVYVDNITYRAWGGTKVVAYSSQEMAQITYTPRMQPAHYELTNKASANYQYHQDGRLSEVIGLSDAKLHQQFTYDQVERIETAQADGGGVAPQQYNNLYGYDAFSNQTDRQSSYWFSSGLGYHATYQNNRISWANQSGTELRTSYDQSGQLLQVEQNPYGSGWQ